MDYALRRIIKSEEIIDLDPLEIYSLIIKERVKHYKLNITDDMIKEAFYQNKTAAQFIDSVLCHQ